MRVPPRQPLVDNLADLRYLVQVPGQPAAVRAFTAAEDAEARQYAAERGGRCVLLPLTDPGVRK